MRDKMKKLQTLKKAGIDIFLSHSSMDKKIAGLLIDLIIIALNILPDKIRCTSIPGFKPDAGANFDLQLRREIARSKIFICILTPASISSAWVLIETGVRMGANKLMIPLISSQHGAALLEGPLKNIQCLNICHEEEIYQFIEQLASELGIQPAPPAVYAYKVKELAALARKS